MLQCGMLIPIHEVSETGIFDKIFIDIGDEQSIENDLSTYSSHLMNMKFFTKNADEKTLILIDEFGTGTEPLLGGAIAEAVLEELNNLKAKGIITTHYSNLKKLGEETEGIINAAMLYDLNKMLPLYKLETGYPGSSFAFEIARKTGISEEILKNAESKLDKNQIDFERVLKLTLKEKRKLSKKTQNIRTIEKNLQETLEKYETELNKTLSERKNILANAKNQAETIFNDANKKIENTIFQIKQNNADKEITKSLRKDLEDFKNKEVEKRKIEEEKILEKIEKIQNKKKKTPKNSEPENIKIEEKKIETGDIVKIKGQNTAGEVIKINKNTFTVAFGSVQMKVSSENIEALSLNQQKEFKKNSKSGVTIVRNEEKNSTNFVSGLDVRGKRGDEALQEVSDYIDNAYSAKVSEIKILHGTGNGILRNLIRDFLRSHNIVKSFKDENIQFGGAGITIVNLVN
jgi:DNA mismatch repair protein MutS2